MLYTEEGHEMGTLGPETEGRTVMKNYTGLHYYSLDYYIVEGKKSRLNHNWG